MPITDYVGIVKVSGQEYLTGSTLFGICTNAEYEPAKIVKIESITNFTPTHGLTIHILFTNSNTAATPTIQFSTDSEATKYPIYQFGTTKVGNSISTSWRAGAIVSLTFMDGELESPATDKRWVLNSSIDTGADGLASVNLNNVQNADDLKAIEALTGTSGYLKKTAANTWVLQTAIDATSSVAGITTVGASGGAAAYSHTHGNIASGGTIGQTSGWTLANGDGLLVFDSSNSNKIERSGITFDGSTTTKALTQKGTWETFNNYSHPTGDGNKHIPANGTTNSGKFLKASATAGTYTWETITTSDISGYPSTVVTSITPGNGLINGTSGSSQAAITSSGTISIKEGGVTNAMLAGSIANEKLANSSITIAGTSVSLGSSISAATLRTKLELSAALRFIGQASTVMAEGDTTTIPTITGVSSYTPIVGDVVLDSSSDSEYVCVAVNNGTYTWERLGRDSSWALDNAVIHNTLLSAKGDMVYASAANTPARLEIGTNGYFLTVSNGVPAWTSIDNSTVGLSNVTNDAQIPKSIGTAAGDIIYWSAASTPARLAKGTDGQVLKMVSGVPAWSTDNNSDTKVTQAYSTTDNSYPILFSATADITSTDSRGAKTAIVNNTIYVNPSTGTIYATKFSGDGSSLTNVTASSVDWSNVANKVLAKLYVNTTATGTNSNVATANTTTYIHLYDNGAVQDTIQLKGDGNISVSSTDAKVITIAAAQFAGATSSTNGTAGYLAAPGSGNQNKFLQGSGGWKALSVAVTENDSGTVVKAASLTKPTFTQGTLATASVSAGVLTIVNQTADTFTQGSLSVTKANLSITAT